MAFLFGLFCLFMIVFLAVMVANSMSSGNQVGNVPYVPPKSPQMLPPAQQTPPPPPPPQKQVATAPAPKISIEDELKKLASMRESGLIDDDDYKAMKKKLIEKM